ncbi:hypothetical protein TNCT_56471 [Trichonephila clavata]|uniref:Uncharacterized protein n=1 Tax=Trichonephila clavata TaxID=2740835 RepID=A0A8X6FI17_TRICU|nr:hypothetical protein TNCT_56471 [Trichonephila clavata]
MNSTLQLLDPSSQEMNTSVEWMELDDQPVDGAGPAYGTLLLDPNSQEMNASVEWMQLDDQSVDGAGPTYGTMVLLKEEVAPPEEIFTLLLY